LTRAFYWFSASLRSRSSYLVCRLVETIIHNIDSNPIGFGNGMSLNISFTYTQA
jgi:hypothetical protein